MLQIRKANNHFVPVAVCDICGLDIVQPGSKFVPEDVTGGDAPFSIICRECNEEINLKGADFGEVLALLAANARVPYSNFIGTFRKAVRIRNELS